MKILLTGATGYLGSHLVNGFVEDGHDVTILLRRVSNTSRIAALLGHLRCYEIEAGGTEALFKEVRNLDIVVHAATSYGRNGETPLVVAEANTLFPLRILDLACANGVETFVNTDSFYVNEITYDFLANYALSKRQFAEWGHRYAEAKRLRFLNVRLEHSFGPGDDESKFVNWIVRECIADTETIELTEGLQQRDFIFIDDVVSAFKVLVTNAGSLNAGWMALGLGTGHAVTVRHFVELVHRLSSSKARLLFGAKPSRRGEIMRSCADNSLLSEMGWSPVFDLETAVRTLITFKSGRRESVVELKPGLGGEK